MSTAPSGAESIIALGGGGPMDVAKAVALLATYGGTVIDYVGLEKVPGPVVPMIAIPTTAGTGSEVTASSVITDSETNFKMSVISHYLIPGYALLDSELIMTLPASIAAACGVDAFVHALEAYLSKMGNPFSSLCSAISPPQNKHAYMMLLLLSRTVYILFLLGPCFLLYDLYSLHYILTNHHRRE